MTAYAAAAAGPLTAEPDKRVNYTLGLVLGVDEFQQEQLYHTAARRGHNRLLHGYGTVWGLALTPSEDDDPDPQIRVSAGVAVDPCGREICVPDTMCVRVDHWLDRHRPTLEALYGGRPEEVPLAVVLCYRECPADVVPIPGEPCRTQEDAMQPSRLRDSFELRLALRDEEAPESSPPGESAAGLHRYAAAHAEERAVRRFGELLARIEMVSVASPPGSGREELLDAVEALAIEPAEASPPPASILLPSDEAPEILREAFRLWVTVVRPEIRKREPGGARCGQEGHECCVLLGEVDLPVTAAWAPGPIAIREDERPVLLHTRLLQEWLQGGGSSGNDDTFATVAPRSNDSVRVWLHYPEALELDPADVTVLVNGGAATSPLGITPVVGLENAFDVQLDAEPGDGATVELRFDLTTIALADSPTSALADALHTGHGGFLDRYGEEVRAYAMFRVHTHTLPDFTGDLTGSHPNATVVGLDGTDVAITEPITTGHVLTWNGGAWDAAAPAGGAPALPPASGDVSGTYPALEVVGLRGNPLADVDPSLNHYLRWNGSAWVPAHVGGFVTAPGGRYAMVAAGHFNEGGAALGPVYGGLAVAMDISETATERLFTYRLRFPGYERPVSGAAHTYIVHAMVHAPEQPVVGLSFLAFDPTAIRMRRYPASRPGTPPPPARIIIDIHRIG
ncbi:MAG TPA: hypothetical protein VMK65_03175 [Longimicrobiales bacterium]|nr:hypothetical protein [Longimicrobiales bacterium]